MAADGTEPGLCRVPLAELQGASAASGDESDEDETDDEFDDAEN